MHHSSARALRPRVFGFGLVGHVLWAVAVIALSAWTIGFAVRGTEERWYRS